MFINDLNKAMISYKTIAFTSGALDPHIEIPVPIGTIELTKEHVQAFFKENPKATHIRMPKGIIKISTLFM